MSFKDDTILGEDYDPDLPGGTTKVTVKNKKGETVRTETHTDNGDGTITIEITKKNGKTKTKTKKKKD